MARISIFYFILLILQLLPDTTVFGQGQNLYIPLDVREAYEKGTRSYDGKPGPNYWQNRSEYKIRATLHPETKLVTGNEIVTYHNDSPDSLDRIVIRLYPDLYKTGNPRAQPIKKEDLHDGVILKTFLINGEDIDLNASDSPAWRRGTNLLIRLDDQIAPGDRLELEIDWQFRLPTETRIRMGAYSDSAFFVGYWYPQIAVYDDIDGWDYINYNGRQEFYNDFSDFEVDITVPNGFTVWATGVLQNGADVLTRNQYKRFQQAASSDEIISILANDHNLNPDEETRTWKFKADNVTDFAFAASNFYSWDATSIPSGQSENSRIFISAAYNPKSNDFYEVARISREAINFLSGEFPGIPYPFPSLTVFNGHNGMEFPMIVNNGSTANRARTVNLTTHEIAHMFFPFFVGTNERKYAWMDEGLTVMLTYDVQLALEPNNDPIENNLRGYRFRAGREFDAAPITPSILLTGGSYNLATYNRPATAYYFLRDVLGDATFKNALRSYIENWNGKHPIPYDFFFTFDRVAGEDLSWFWNPWFFQTGYPDLSIKEVTYDSGHPTITVKRSGNIPVPVRLKITYADDSVEIIDKTAAVWKNGAAVLKILASEKKKVRKIELGDVDIPDMNLIDNVYESEQVLESD